MNINLKLSARESGRRGALDATLLLAKPTDEDGDPDLSSGDSSGGQKMTGRVDQHEKAAKLRRRKYWTEEAEGDDWLLSVWKLNAVADNTQTAYRGYVKDLHS